jgi:hypothetical protein
MKWTAIADRLPPEPEKMYGSKWYLATVADNQVIAVKYVKTSIRNKEVFRWEWQRRICPWKVIAWMPFPECYKAEGVE